MDKIDRMVENFGVDEVMWAAARDHLKKLGEIVDEPGEADGDGADIAAETEEPAEANALDPFGQETAAGRIIFI